MGHVKEKDMWTVITDSDLSLPPREEFVVLMGLFQFKKWASKGKYMGVVDGKRMWMIKQIREIDRGMPEPMMWAKFPEV